MSEAPPILVRYVDGNFVPANAPMAKRCEQHFQQGELYRIDFREDRSSNSHKHYFASINSAFKNLPENYAHLCPTPDDLRRRALIVNGYADHIDLVGIADEAAIEIARQIRRHGGYAIVTSNGNVHRIYIAKSQSMRAMDKHEFQASKQAVLNTISDWIGVDPATLAANADHEEQREPNPVPASDRDATPTDNVRPPTQEPDREPEMNPRTPAEYLQYLHAWLSYVKSAERIMTRIQREKAELWPTLDPKPTLGQTNQYMRLATDAANKL